MRKKFRKAVSIILMAALVFSMSGISYGSMADTDGYWAENEISAFVENGYVNGYADGTFKGDNSITRAEFVKLVNRSFGFIKTAAPDFKDVGSGGWYYEDVAKAKSAGYISGYSNGNFMPNASITREEAASIIAKLIGDPSLANQDLLKKFSDSDKIAAWSKDAVSIVLSKGYINGYPDMTFQAKSSISRAEAVVMLDRAINGLRETITYGEAGAYGVIGKTTTINGNAIISVPNVILQDMVIKGNLILTAGVGEGNVTLKNVVVEGNTIVRGGGSNSVLLENAVLPEIIVSKEGVRIVASGTTSVKLIKLESGATLAEINGTGAGFEQVRLTQLIPEGAKVILNGSFAEVTASADNISIAVQSGTIAVFNVAKAAVGLDIDLAEGVVVSVINIDAAVAVTGKGAIETAVSTVAGSTFETSPGTVTQTETGSAASDEETITISQIELNNTFGSFRFATDKVATAADLMKALKANGEGLQLIEKREKGEDGKSWKAYLQDPEHNKDYVITCSSPYEISGTHTIRWDTTAASAVTNLTVDDVDDNGDGRDLEVSFTKADGETQQVGSYRILVVKSSDATGFDLAAAEAVAAANYTEVAKSGSDTVTTLSSSAKDTDGDQIDNDIYYKVFVLTVADGTNATVNALSAASTSIRLTTDSGGSGGSGDPDDESAASAALAAAGSKVAGATFNLNITGAKNTSGNDISGDIPVTVTSDLDGQVYAASPTFTAGAATVVIPAGEVTTAGTNTLTVAVTGVTPQPQVSVTVTAATQINSADSTVDVSPALAAGSTSTFTVTLKDPYGNLMVNTTKNIKIKVTLTTTDTATEESYTVAGNALAASATLTISGAPLDANGQYVFTAILPETIDEGDGIAIQVMQNNSVDLLGSEYSYINVSDPSDALAELAVAGSKTAGTSFDLSLNGVKDTLGTELDGDVLVTVTSDLDGQVYSGNVLFAAGAASVTIPAGEVTTAGTNTLAVAITGVTVQPNVEVTVTAATQISSANSTVAVSPALAADTTSTFTVTLKDAYGNVIANTTKSLKIKVTLTNLDAATAESYTVGGTAVTASTTLTKSNVAIDANGQYAFTAVLPATIDVGDGVAIQVMQNNGVDLLGSEYSYANVPDLSAASADLAVLGSKVAGTSFDLSLTSVRGTSGADLAGDVLVTVTSDVDDEVFSDNVTFTAGAATVVIAAGEVTTAGTNMLTVAIEGVTPQPIVEVTVTAATQISTVNSTVEVSPALAADTTSTFTVTLKDTYGNLIANTTKSLKIKVIITNLDATTAEAYTVGGTVVAVSTTLTKSNVAIDANGQYAFTEVLPSTIDTGDGSAIQVMQNNGVDLLGSEYSYIQL